MPRKAKQKNTAINLAPNLERSWLEIELRPSPASEVTSERVKQFQEQLAEVCGMHVFCGPMIIAPDSTNTLSPYYTNAEFRPLDWNAYTWWTVPDATNIISILNHSHESFYYYPRHNLIDISIATCKEYDLPATLKFVNDFWKPDKRGMRYAFLSPKAPGCSWKIYPELPSGRKKSSRKK